MKNGILKVLGFILLSGLMFSCEKGVDNQKLLQQSYNLRDYSTATLVAQSIYLEDTINNVSMLDSLLILYRIIGNNNSAARINELYGNKISTYRGLRSISEALRVKGDFDGSLKILNKIEEQFPDENLLTEYDLGQIYFSKKDFASSKTHLNKVLSHPKAKEQTLAVYTNDFVQIVSYYDATRNILGFIAMSEGDFVLAQKTFDEILTDNPDFQLAKNNLTLLANTVKRLQEQQK